MNRKPIIPAAQMSVTEARKALDEYLKDVKHDVSLSSLGMTIYVSLVYYDFKPRRTVRNEIENLAPNIEVDDIRREYSHEAIVSAFYEDGDDSHQVYVKLPNGDLIPTNVHTLLTERMSHKTYSESRA